MAVETATVSYWSDFSAELVYGSLRMPLIGNKSLKQIKDMVRYILPPDVSVEYVDRGHRRCRQCGQEVVPR